MEIRYVELQDKAGWYLLDRHLPEAGFDEKVRNKQGYVLLGGDKIAGVLRSRKLGYKDCGGFVVDVPGYEQPMEMIMIRAI